MYFKTPIEEILLDINCCFECERNSFSDCFKVIKLRVVGCIFMYPNLRLMFYTRMY